MFDYNVFNNTFVGASHIRRGTRCQDASLSLSEKGAAIAAVADGHGSEAYFRSEIGAHFAADIAVNCAADFIKSITPDMLTDADSVNRQLIQLEKCIIMRWGETVEEHREQFPFTEEEEKIFAESRQREIYSVYGTTLIAAAVTPAYWFAFQIGDGKCAALADGIWSEPVPWDEKCFLNATTSICDSRAVDEFRHYFSGNLPAAVFLCTDGICDSYGSADDLFLVYSKTAETFARTGFARAKKTVSRMLPAITSKGSGDDVSLAGILSKTAVKNAFAPHLGSKN
ncbi:MAG: protein phosphatase 2C domain-containing protein [Ruminococcus sp.]|nr:protein phosphatase 2C domain-containing protein [Ruminococcus sp.]